MGLVGIGLSIGITFVAIIGMGVLFYDAPIDSSEVKVYVHDVPSYAHESITKDVVYDALNSWERINPDLNFVYVDKSDDFDIEIKWTTVIPFEYHVMGISENVYSSDSAIIPSSAVITIDLVDSDCNMQALHWDRDTVTDTISHEMGHALGIIEHSSDETHLLFDVVDGIDNLDTLGYSIPLPLETYQYYIGERAILEALENPNASQSVYDEWNCLANSSNQYALISVE